MKITAPQREHADALYALYRDSVAAAPHCCFVPSPTRFRHELLGQAVPRLFLPPHEQRLFVAEANRTVRGFAALAAYTDWGGAEHQAITALCFADEVAGQALIAACEVGARGGMLLAYPNSHGKAPISSYNAGWNGLSDRIPAVAQVLARAGYAPYYRELHMSCDLVHFPPVQVSLPTNLNLHKGLDERGRVWLRALIGEQTVADCIVSTLVQLSDDPRSVRTGYVWGMGVSEGFRRRGIARRLMSAALLHLMAQGCDACWLTTGADNWPAQSLYLSLGFEVMDCSACFRKRLGPIT